MSEFEPIRAIKAREQRRLLRIPGVHAVGIGAKVVGGRQTDEAALTIFVVHKKPLDQLAAEHVIPAEIDGIKTDVIEMPRVKFLALPDDDKERPLLAGTKMTVNNTNYFGSIGCYARDAKGRALGLTCHHVVARHFTGTATLLTVVPPHPPLTPPNPYSATFSGQDTAGTTIAVQLESASANKDWATYITTSGTDTIPALANNVVTAVNALASTNAMARLGTGIGQVIITANPGANTVVRSFEIYSPLGIDPKAKLFAKVTGNSIEFSGKVAGDYGIYVTWSLTGTEASQGSFTAVDKDSTLDHVASAVLSSVFMTPGQNADPTRTGNTVVLTNATYVICQIINDLRAGQPSDDSCSDCSLCCNDNFGRVLLADLSVDAAAVQIRSGIEYLDEVKEDPTHGVANHTLIVGPYTPTDDQIRTGYQISKRGFVTGITRGVITHEMALIVGEHDSGRPSVFDRFFEHAYRIQGIVTPFSDQGDSGGPVYDAGGHIVGLLFAGTSTIGVASPIQRIQDQLGVTVEGATALGQKHKVTDVDGYHLMAVADERLRRALEAQTEISATPQGKELADAVLRNVPEVQTLINSNLRVAATWQRNGGPLMVKSLLQFLEDRTVPMPNELNGLPLVERLKNIQRSLVKCGSETLVADLERYSSFVLELANLSFSEVLARLQTSSEAVLVP